MPRELIRLLSHNKESIKEVPLIPPIGDHAGGREGRCKGDADVYYMFIIYMYVYVFQITRYVNERNE